MRKPQFASQQAAVSPSQHENAYDMDSSAAANLAKPHYTTVLKHEDLKHVVEGWYHLDLYTRIMHWIHHAFQSNYFQ